MTVNDSNFGNGVYASARAPHQWRSQEEVLLNNYFPSKRVWDDRNKRNLWKWPQVDVLNGDKSCLTDEQLENLLNTPFGIDFLKMWQGKAEFCIPIICDRVDVKD